MRKMAKVLLVSAGVAVSAMVSQPASAAPLSYHYGPVTFGAFVQYVMSFLSGHDAGAAIAGEAQARH